MFSFLFGRPLGHCIKRLNTKVKAYTKYKLFFFVKSHYYKLFITVIIPIDIIKVTN